MMSWIKHLLAAILCLISASANAQMVPAHATIDSAPSAALTVAASSHGANTAVGGLITLPVFRNRSDPSGLIDAVIISSSGGSAPTLTVYIYDSLPSATTCTDAATFVEGAADVLKRVLAPFTLTLAATQGVTTTTAETALSRSTRNYDSPPTLNLYACLVTGGAFTPAANDFSIKFSMFRNGGN